MDLDLVKFKESKSKLFGFYGISTFVGYLIPNQFLYKLTVLFQTIQFSISIQFVKNCMSISAIQFSQTVLIKTIQFRIVFVYTQCQNSSISTSLV